MGSNEKSLDPKVIVEAGFAILVIALLDQGETEPVARGFALAVPGRRRLHGDTDDRESERHEHHHDRRQDMINTADIKTGFWVASGVLLALLIWGLLTGGLGRITGRG